MPNLLTVKQMAEKHKAFSEASLRYHIFHEEANGLSKALTRLGRKILINEELFFNWLDDQSGGASWTAIQEKPKSAGLVSSFLLVERLVMWVKSPKQGVGDYLQSFLILNMNIIGLF